MHHLFVIGLFLLRLTCLSVAAPRKVINQAPRVPIDAFFEEANDASFKQSCLDAHNRYRSRHGVPLLKWSGKLTNDAQDWANHLAASGKWEHDPTARGKDQGENLYYFNYPTSLSSEEMVKEWYAEEANYDYKTGEAKEQDAQIYHFTQIVWKTTKKLGMATAVSGGRTVAVARYSPVGNWLGEFKENVLPPKKVR